MAADCNCSNPSCPCYKGNQDKAGEQQAPSPEATPSTNSGATQNTNGHTHGGTMTAPVGGNGNSGGGDIRSVQDMRTFWQKAGTTAASAGDPLQSATSQLDALAAQLEAVQTHANQHGDEYGGPAAAGAETYRQLAQKCRDAADAVDAAVGGCANAETALEPLRGAEEALQGLRSRHKDTDAYV